MSDTNSKTQVIAERYTRAIIELAEKNGMTDSVKNDLDLVSETYKTSSELRIFLEHPVIPVEEKKDAIAQILKDSVSEYVLNFLKLLIDKNRFGILPDITAIYTEAMNKKNNIVTAEVTTAVDLDEETAKRLKNKLETVFKCNIKITSTVNNDIIAGMIVKLGDKTIDGSIKTKFENMKKQLI